MSDDQGQVMNTLLRMVVPIRREFGRSLDVKHFLHDLEYRQDIIQQALGSQDSQLRDYAQYVQKLMSGPRTSANPPTPPSEEGRPSIIERAEPSGPTTARGKDGRTEGEMREQILRKYTQGLR
jgi:hypothetical protein